ncbi:MbtH family NRPS accessory protein [Streptomyces sp. rh34]|uniref:MbtH family NRPS accessory protein n=1 Tax=Streptomyces sp. rh34 TaxID=2034272 RepID=UPI000BF08782
MSDAISGTDRNADWLIVCTQEGRHSIWPRELPIPPGWTRRGPAGAKPECLEWIAKNWLDPRSAGVGGEAR